MFHEHNKLPYDQSSLGFVFTASEYDAEFTRRTIRRAPPQVFVVPKVGLDR